MVARRVSYRTGARPYSVTLGNLDGDGKLDLAVTNEDASSVTVWRGNGNGTFGSRLDYGCGGSPTAAAIADLDHDGRMELVVADWLESSASVLRNVGAAPVGVTAARTPARFAVLSTSPNPSHDAVTIRFALPDAGPVDASAFDLAGRRVRVLANGAVLAAGEHALRWDRLSETGDVLPAGIYLVRLRAAGKTAVTRIVVLR